VNDLQCFVHAFPTHGAQTVKKRAADVTAFGAQRARLEYILTAADAAVHVHFDLLANRIHDLRQGAYR